MCGIFGVARKPHNVHSTTVANNNKTIKKLFEALAKRSMVRGTDSTGAILIRKPSSTTTSYQGTRTTTKESGGMVFMAKDMVRADEFLKGTNYLKLLDCMNKYTLGLIGHTRASSSAGPHDNANNHPHACGSVVGVHNGHISNWRKLATSYNLKMRGGCDSEVIFGLINKLMEEDHMTVRAAIQRTATVLEGYYACAMVTSDMPNNIYLFRKGAPLKIRHRVYGNVVIFASEEKFIRGAFKDADIESKHSPSYYEMNEFILPDGHGLVLDSGGKDYQSWIQEVETFKLDP